MNHFRMAKGHDRAARCLACVISAVLGLAFSTCAAAEPRQPIPELARSLVQSNQGFWRSCAEPPESLSSRTIFAYALALCEARQHPERLERLFTLAAQMQDRDPKSRQYGNFRWYWRDPKVMDANAVDFCMRGGSLIWLKHLDFVPAEVRPKLRELLQLSALGLRGHKVPPSYSNIALMNAGDLILLGEALGDAAVAAEGYSRLQGFFNYTRTNGVHEFVSPTYTGVDLDGLGMVQTYARKERGRKQAGALLELFWTDIALNWFSPAQRLAGAHSRTYDFLYGGGSLSLQMQWQGWISGPPVKALDMLYTAESDWHPPERVRALSSEYPRLIRQSWGEQPWQSRTHYLCADVTLSTSASAYGGRMDMPLTVDLPGPPKSVRGYFVADGRGDPYGMNKIPAGPHSKAFHLDPFWCAVQTTNEALALVVYREKDIPTNAVHLESDFVLPLKVDEFRIGTEVVKFEPKKAASYPVAAGQAVLLKLGRAVVGIRVPWASDCAGAPAAQSLVYDGNDYGAVRFVVQHSKEAPLIGKPPAALFFVRVASGLDRAASAAWGETFAKTPVDVELEGGNLRARVGAKASPRLSLAAAEPWKRPGELVPAPSRGVLESDGLDLGEVILSRAE